MKHSTFRYLIKTRLLTYRLGLLCVSSRVSKTLGPMLLLCAVLSAMNVSSQVTTLYSTDFGTTGALPTGWTVAGSSPWTMSNVNPSTTPTFSGSYNAASGASNNARTITYSNNLSTVGYSNITVQWAARRSYANNVTFFWSPNGGTTWNALAITDVANNSTWAWVNGGTRISLPAGAEGVANLSFYWSYDSDGTGGRYRMDDFSVQGCQKPAQPSVISGSTTPCQGTSQVYSVTNVAGVTYNWIFPAGWTQTAGGTTNSVTVTVGANSGNVTVTPSNACGNGTSRTLAVSVLTIPSQPSAITGASTPCLGSSQNYSVTNVAGVTYNWTFPAGWTQTGGGTSNSVTVTVGAGSGNVVVTPSNACGNGTSRQLSVSPVMAAPLVPGSFSGNLSPCEGTTEIYSVGNVAGVTFTWSLPAGWSITSGQGTNTITVTVGANSGNITVTPSNSCGNGPVLTMAATVYSVPAQPSVISGNANVCQGDAQSYSVINVAGVTYTWSFPADWTITSGQGSSSVTVTVGASSGNVQVIPSTICGSGTGRTLAVTVLSVPAQPSAISGNTMVCRFSLQVYSVTNVPGVTYTWTAPAGWIIFSGQGTNSITVVAGPTSGNITVTPSNACGSGTAQTLAVTVQMAAPAMPSAISGNASPCQGTTQVYSVTNVVGVTYTWSVPIDWIIVSGQGTNSITVTVGFSSGNITVSPSNTCGGGASRILAVASLSMAPAQPSPINGNDTICLGSSQTYSVSNIPYATFTWSVPADWTILLGQGTRIIQVSVGAMSGTITVTPSNSCGLGIARTLDVVVEPSAPIKPSAISGNSTPCEGSSYVYSITGIAGVTYNWNLPSGWTFVSGQGTTSITVVVGANSGLITVTPVNSCGVGPSRQLDITVSPLPASAGSITGPTSFCEGTTLTYSITTISGQSYTWSFPAGWTIISGQGTGIIQVIAGVNSGNVTVTPVNGCGNGPASLLPVTVNPKPAAFTGPNATLCVGASIQLGGPAVPGNTYSWTSVPVGFTSNISNPTVQPTETTTYTLIEINPVTGCSDTNSVTVVANQVINISVIPASLTDTICSGETTNISLSSNVTGTTFSWTATLTSGSGTTFNGSGSGSNIQEIITNTSSSPAEVTYSITAMANECINSLVDIVITVLPFPTVNNQSATVCSDVASAITLGASTNGVGAISYNITAINNGGLTTSAGNPIPGNGLSGNVIADDAWTNTTTNPVNVVYSVTPVSASGCPGAGFTVTLTVNPEPQMNIPSTSEICSSVATNISLTSTIPSTYSWVIGTITGGITGASNGSGSAIAQTLVNPGTTDGTVEYLITPVSVTGTCAGDVFTMVVTVHPQPTVTNASTLAICSGNSVNIPLTANTASTFSWTIGAITGGITGASAGSGNTINQVLNNPSNVVSGTVQYIITPTSSAHSCSGSPLTITVTVNPVPLVTAGASVASICPGATFNLTSSSNISTPPVIFTENFNSATNSWSRTNTSTGGTTANATWTLRADGYITNATTFHSNDASQFYMSDSRSQNGTVTATTLVSPTLSTVGYSALSLSFYHHFDFNSTTGESARVQVSTDGGGSWNTVATYTSDRGGAASFQNEVINLGATYINSNSFLIRFNYYCGSNRGRYWSIDNVVLSGTPSATPSISWTSNPSGFTSAVANPTGVSLAVTTEYTVSYTNSLTSCSSSNSVTVTAYPVPQPTIIAEYCVVPGKIRLTATGGGTYLWNTGETTAVIEVDVAGMYSVIVTNASGCSATAYLSVSNELVVNGDFSAGNTGFSSGYAYDPAANGLIAPESEYAINNNANFNHPNFWGYDHTLGTGTGNANFLIVNGAKYAPQPYVWRETVTVLPNTTYYFSAWAISLNNVAPFAQLRFSVNGTQVGTTANLTSGQNILNNPWLLKDRFYGTWFSGAATTAVIEILDLNTSANGNDFGIDDVSFGTLAQIPFLINPSSSDTAYCEGDTVQLFANIVGGRPVILYNWTGPNGFTSTIQNPTIPGITAASAGRYYLSVTDGYNCVPQVDSVDIQVLSLPTVALTGPSAACQFSPSPGITFTGSGGTAPYTFIYRINGGGNQTVTTVAGNSVTVSVPTNVSGTFTYTVTSVSSALGCSQTVNVTKTIVINTLPTCYITGSSPVCPGSVGNLYSGIVGMSSYGWTISGNGTIVGPANTLDVSVTAGANCNDVFLLTLMSTDINGCNAICQEEILVEDITAPLDTCPSNIVTLADPGYSYATINVPAPSFTDDCTSSGSLLISWTMSSPTAGTGSGLIPAPYQFNLGTTTVTYTVTDLCGNSSVCSFTVTVNPNNPPVIQCQDEIYQGTDIDVCTASINPGSPIIISGTGITFSWSMTGATIGSGTGNITPNPYTFNRGITLITWVASNAGGTDTCTQLITVVDDQAPDFIPPAPQSYCVINLVDANYFDPTMDITPDRPEYYILTMADKAALSPDPASFVDNCSAPGNLTLYWRIDFDGGVPASINGTGPLTNYLGDILFPGAVSTNVIHTISYWIEDEEGNVSNEKTITITITPRPNIIKQ